MAEMATEISTRGRQRAIGHEEYSLYSSLSEEELLQMAIEQSLADKTRGPTPAEASASSLHLFSDCTKLGTSKSIFYSIWCYDPRPIYD